MRSLLAGLALLAAAGAASARGPGPGGTYDADMAVFVNARTGSWLGALSF